ncbi:DUF4199 domain-containing protein [Hymenobacter negativus]|uniref:DUF4199 domain-containing protein n=1 Tax=Hymenobacter negativus TaxID=2795026 RepID=A0ABS3QAM6_9BACT|nr:DUF4199 domain-containing protein [Hymenobacter negativus]MBO2008251.1 DUF4199 domain-containing protein [Hymenobacter negativus]
MADSSLQPKLSGTDSLAGLATRLAVRAGLGVGLLGVIWTVGLQLTGNNGFGPKQIMAQMLVPLVAVANEWWLGQQLKPEKPGLGRSLKVGLLTVLIAAVVSGLGVLGLAYGAGETALARNRAEVTEIVRVQQLENSKVKQSEAQIRQQEQNVVSMTTPQGLAISTFERILLFGLVLAVPGGIFFRE